MTGTTLKIAICDDDDRLRADLSDCIRSVPPPQGFRLELSQFDSGDALASAFAAGERFDIVVIDMMMPGMTGIETAKAIRPMDEDAIIICLTNSPDFAVQSYRIDAFDYLLKSNDWNEFKATLSKALSIAASRDSAKLRVRSGTAVHTIRCRDIEFIEVNGKKLSYHLVSGEAIESYKSMRELESELAGQSQFFMIHRSIVVNLSYVVELDPRYVRTLTSERLPVARGKRPSLEEAFLRHAVSRPS
jgi:DNA-binding LytR/AlgR family response regulator